MHTLVGSEHRAQNRKLGDGAGNCGYPEGDFSGLLAHFGARVVSRVVAAVSVCIGVKLLAATIALQ